MIRFGFGFAFLPMFASWFGSCWFTTSLKGSEVIGPIFEGQTNRFEMIQFYFCKLHLFFF